MFCDLNYRLDEGALEGLEKDGETIFQRIRQRQGCEEKQALCLCTVGIRIRSIDVSSKVLFMTLILFS